MKRMIYISMFVLLLALSASAEDVRVQASVPGEAGTVELTVTLDAGNPTIMDNYSSIGPGPSAVPEPSTLALVIVGIGGVILWKKLRERR